MSNRTFSYQENDFYFPPQIVVPARLCDLIRQGVVSTKEVVLLLVIINFPPNENNDTSCWLTNQELARLIKAHEKSVSRIISKLQKQGLLQVVSNREGRRITSNLTPS